MDAPVLAICEEYRSALNDLKVNSKPLINMLTMLAEENSNYAFHIVKVIEDQVNKALPAHKLPLLYLIDSIIKNVKTPYLELINDRIVVIFSGVFEKVDEKIRVLLYKLRQTWTELFPNKHLYMLDLAIKSLDPAWPIIATPSAQPPKNIHVNPKFLPKNEKELSNESLSEKLSPTLKNNLNDDSIWQINIAKKHEMLKQQQEKLEMEIAQTKAKLLASQHPKLLVKKDNIAKKSLNKDLTSKTSTLDAQPRDPRLKRVANMPTQRAPKAKEESLVMDGNNNEKSKAEHSQDKHISESQHNTAKADQKPRLDKNYKDKLDSSVKRKSRSPVTQKHEIRKLIDKDERLGGYGEIVGTDDKNTAKRISHNKQNGPMPKFNKSVPNKDFDHRNIVENKLSYSNKFFAPPPLELPTIPRKRKDSNQRSNFDSKKRASDSSIDRNNEESLNHTQNITFIKGLLSDITSKESKAIDMEKQADILKSAATLMQSGKLSHEQHQELLKQLHQLFILKESNTTTTHSINNNNNCSRQQNMDTHNNRAPHKTCAGGEQRIYNSRNAYNAATNKDISPIISSMHPENLTLTNIIAAKRIGNVERVLIDGKEREIHFHSQRGFIVMDDNLPHGISFKGATRGIVIGDMHEQLPCGADKTLYVDGKAHTFTLGAPSKELFVDGKPYEIRFGQAIDILLDGRAHHIKLLGPPPDVKIDPDAFYHPADFSDALAELRNGQPGDIHLYAKVLGEMGCPHCRKLLEDAFTLEETNTTKIPSSSWPPRMHIAPNRNARGGIKMNRRLPPPPPVPSFMLMPSAPFPATIQDYFPLRTQRIMMGLGCYDATPPPHLNHHRHLTYDDGGAPQPSFSLPPSSSTPSTSNHPSADLQTRTHPSADHLEEAHLSATTQSSDATIDVNLLLSNLVKSGLLATNSPADVETRSADNSGDQKEEQKKLEEREEDMETELNTKIPNLDFTDMAALKNHYPGIVNQLYNGIQCSSCGMRFTVHQTDRYAQHLDWHFRQNRREKDMAGKRHHHSKGAPLSSMYNRPWYYTAEDWVQLEEIGDFSDSDKAKSEIFESQQAKRDKGAGLSGKKESIEAIQNILNMAAVHQPSTSTHFNEYDTKSYRYVPSNLEESSQLASDLANDLQSPIIVDDKLDAHPIAGEHDTCEVCHEPFEQGWDEDEEEWILKNAIRVRDSGKTYHPLCYEDSLLNVKVQMETLEENLEIVRSINVVLVENLVDVKKEEIVVEKSVKVENLECEGSNILETIKTEVVCNSDDN